MEYIYNMNIDNIDSDNDQIKYPKSKKGKTCLGPCYKPKTYIIHPINLEYVTSTTVPFCPVAEYTENNEKFFIDECFVATTDQEIKKTQIEKDIILPLMPLNCDNFLKLFYGIDSFDSALNYITEKKVPLYSKLRILDCSWKIYGDDLDMIDDRLINFIIYLIKTKWIKFYRNLIVKYISVDNGNIFFKTSFDDSDYKIIEKTNFFIDKFVNKNTIYKFLQIYTLKYKNKWESIDSHNENIKKEFEKYIKKKIKKII